MNLAFLKSLEAARDAKHEVCAVRLLENAGALALVVDGEQTAGEALPDDVLAAARDALRHDRSQMITSSLGRVFLQVFNPPLRLVIVGAVHIAQALVPFAALAGYAVTVIDPRRAFATDERFPDVTISTEWPDDAVEALRPDRRTAVVTLTHDPKLDDPALDVTLRSDAFYIAALGSRRTHAGRIQRLTELGHVPETIARIHGPAGLAIGAVSPAEIAISVLAEMTAALHAQG